jgi:hypothetical protein
LLTPNTSILTILKQFFSKIYLSILSPPKQQSTKPIFRADRTPITQRCAHAFRGSPSTSDKHDKLPIKPRLTSGPPNFLTHIIAPIVHEPGRHSSEPNSPQGRLLPKNPLRILHLPDDRPVVSSSEAQNSGNFAQIVVVLRFAKIVKTCF